MGLLNIIRRMHLRQKLSIREISRRTGLPSRLDAQHAEAILIVVERHALHNPRQHVLRRLLGLWGGVSAHFFRARQSQGISNEPAHMPRLAIRAWSSSPM
jgi:hypothetical protein